MVFGAVSYVAGATRTLVARPTGAHAGRTEPTPHELGFQDDPLPRSPVVPPSIATPDSDRTEVLDQRGDPTMVERDDG